MLKAVLFDLDNTLISRDQAFRECVEARFSDPNVREQLWRLDDRGRGDRKTLLAHWGQHGGGRMDQDTFGCLIAHRLRPDVDLLAELRALSNRVNLGIITNGGSVSQRKKIRAAGLESVFPADRIWVSGEVGIAKPHRDIFLLAAQALGVAPCQCLHIGDNETDDYAGAKSVGMRGHLVEAALTARRLNELMSMEDLR